MNRAARRPIAVRLNPTRAHPETLDGSFLVRSIPIAFPGLSESLTDMLKVSLPGNKHKRARHATEVGMALPSTLFQIAFGSSAADSLTFLIRFDIRTPSRDSGSRKLDSRMSELEASR